MIDLFSFQQVAANQLVQGFIDYFANGPDRSSGRDVPFVGQLKAVTGAGKTPILANVIGRLNHAIVLWTTKFGSVVDQTAANLRTTGKYHHLLGAGKVEVLKFSDIKSGAQWQRILEQEEGLTVLVSTVAAWNSSEKDPRLNVHRAHPDWGDATKTRWQQLKEDRHRRLWVVYDEAHNTTTEQIELLDDLDPAGFFVASASPVGGKLQMYLSTLSDDARKKRIIPVKTRDVVEKELLKSTISVEDYHSSAEEMIREAASRRASLESALKGRASSIVPKAIYVVESSSSTAAAPTVEPRPVTIWKVLVNSCGVDPAHIAICTKTPPKDLPKDARRVNSINQLSEDFTHIIFNKKLQEGWDDPSVYLCYFDGKTESANRIQQVIGRALRQPNTKHFDGDEDLNTAAFFIHCPSKLVEKITDELKEDLRIYKGDDEDDDFEPFKFKQERKALPKIPLKSEFESKLRVPRFQPELPSGRDPLRELVERETYGFEDDDERRAPGQVLVNVVSVKTGDTTVKSRDLLEDMRVRCGGYLQEQIRSHSRDCANAMHTSVFVNKKLERTACYGSKALDHYKSLALRVVKEYENFVQLGEFSDPDHAEYVVGPHQPLGHVYKKFDHAAHKQYDSGMFKGDELDVAKALDKHPYPWIRNRDRIGYGIPLPVKLESSSAFFPDFLWWVGDTVWAIDPTGRFILEEKVRYKLLSVPPPMKIALLTPKKLDNEYRVIEQEGWTLLRHRIGNAHPQRLNTIEEALAELIEDSEGVVGKSPASAIAGG